MFRTYIFMVKFILKIILAFLTYVVVWPLALGSTVVITIKIFNYVNHQSHLMFGDVWFQVPIVLGTPIAVIALLGGFWFTIIYGIIGFLAEALEPEYEIAAGAANKVYHDVTD